MYNQVQPKSSFLEFIDKEMNTINTEMDTYFGDISYDDYNYKPTKKWSIAECFDHLIKAADTYLPLLQEKIADPDDFEEGDGEYKSGKICRSYIDVFVNQREKIKAKSPKKFVPRQTSFELSDMENLKEINSQLIALTPQCQNLDINKNILRPPNKRFFVVWVKTGWIWHPTLSPASKVYKFSIGETFELMTSHTRRHLEQAKEYLGTYNIKDIKSSTNQPPG